MKDIKDTMKEEIKGKQNKGNGILSKLNVQLLISLFLFLFLIFPAFSAPADDIDLEQLEQYLEKSSYSDFQKRMVANSTREAIEKGISEEDTLSIIKASIDNKVDPYNVKKFLDTAISAKDIGISEKPLINKVKEGLVKNVEAKAIIEVLNRKLENMETAQILLAGKKLSDEKREEIIDVLADSLANGVSSNALERVLAISSEQGKSWKEVEEVAKELAGLSLKATELGIGSDKLETIFHQALDNGNSMENICMNIQDLITAQIAVQVSSGTSSQDVCADGAGNITVISDIPTSSGSAISGSGPTAPAGESGSSPFSSGSGDTSDNESGSSPFK